MAGFVLALQPQQGLWITYRWRRALSRRYRKSAPASGSSGPSKKRSDSRRESQSASVIRHLCLAGETRWHELNNVSGRDEDEPPAATASVSYAWMALDLAQVHKHTSECRGRLSKLRWFWSENVKATWIHTHTHTFCIQISISRLLSRVDSRHKEKS